MFRYPGDQVPVPVPEDRLGRRRSGQLLADLPECPCHLREFTIAIGEVVVRVEYGRQLHAAAQFGLSDCPAGGRPAGDQGSHRGHRGCPHGPGDRTARRTVQLRIGRLPARPPGEARPDQPQRTAPAFLPTHRIAAGPANTAEEALGCRTATTSGGGSHTVGPAARSEPVASAVWPVRFGGIFRDCSVRFPLWAPLLLLFLDLEFRFRVRFRFWRSKYDHRRVAGVGLGPAAVSVTGPGGSRP